MKELEQLDDGIAHTFVLLVRQIQSFGTKIGESSGKTDVSSPTEAPAVIIDVRRYSKGAPARSARVRL